MTRIPPRNTRVPPFFANLLPEGPLRAYLARQAGVNEKREFVLLWALGRDLPGALTVRAADGTALPPDADSRADDLGDERRPDMLRFSLAGVQLKFPALMNAGKPGGLVIPAQGVGGSWIVKLPSARYAGIPENEFSMMTLARRLGMDVPDARLPLPDHADARPDGNLISVRCGVDAGLDQVLAADAFSALQRRGC